MKKIKYISMLFMVMLLCIVPVNAENMDGGDYIPPGDENDYEYDEMYPECLAKDYECIAAHVEGVGTSTAEDIQQAIRSLDPEIAQQEANKDYLVNFQNSTITAMTDTLNPLMPHTIVMQIANFLVTIIEMIGGCFSLLCLVAYNLMSGSAIESIISQTLDIVSSVVFNWSDTSSWVYNLLFLIAFISFVRKVMYIVTKQGGLATHRSIYRAFTETILSVCMIVFIGLYGRPTIQFIESMAEDSIVTTFSLGDFDEPMEIAMKDQIFDIMQMKSFMMRHFGTTDIERLPMDEGTDYDDLQTFNEGRLKKLLTDPSTTTARAEKKLGNGVITQGMGTAFAGILFSFLGLIHKIIAGIVVIILVLLLGVIRVVKEVLLFFSIFGLILMLLQPKNHQVYKWFFNRLMWVLLSILAGILFSVLLYAWSNIINAIIGAGFIFAIIIDIIILIMLWLAWKFRDDIIAKFNELNADGMMSGIFNGTLSPKSVLQSLTNANDHSSSGNVNTTDDEVDDNQEHKDDRDAMHFDETLSDRDDTDTDQTNEDITKAEVGETNEEVTEADVREDGETNDNLSETDTNVTKKSTVEDVESETEENDLSDMSDEQQKDNDSFRDDEELNEVYDHNDSNDNHVMDENNIYNGEENIMEEVEPKTEKKEVHSNVSEAPKEEESEEMEFKESNLQPITQIGLDEEDEAEEVVDLADYYD